MKRLFFRNINKPYPWWKLILWWEFRRVIFNIVCIPLVIITWSNLNESTNSTAGGSPFYYILFFIGYLIFINLHYTFFWILDLILNAIQSNNTKSFQKYFFIVSIITGIIASRIILEILYL